MNFGLHRSAKAPASKTQSFLDSYLPTIIQVAALSLPIAYNLYEKYFAYENLSNTVRRNLQSEDSNVRENAVNDLANELALEKASKLSIVPINNEIVI